MEYVIIAVILIIGFIALAYFLIRLNIQGLGQDTACKLSILAKATAPNYFPKLGPSIPVECITKKICIGGKCDDNFKGEKDVQTIKLDDDKYKAINQTAKVVADSFYNCWNDMGRGKLDLFSSLSTSVTGTNPAKPICVICSRIALDKTIDPERIKDMNIRQYMQYNKAPNSEFNYFRALGLESDPTLNSRTLEVSKLAIDPNNPRKTDEVAVVFMQISAPSQFVAGGSLVAGTVVGAGSLAFIGSKIIPKSVFSIFSPKIILKGTTIGAIALAVGSLEFLYGETASALSRADAAAYCGVYGNKESTGCSVVQIMPYDKGSINSLCDVIEGEA